MEKTFTVNGMKCVHCKARVEEVLRGLDGVDSAVASVECGSVTVGYDDGSVSPERMKEAVENAGRYEFVIDE